MRLFILGLTCLYLSIAPARAADCEIHYSPIVNPAVAPIIGKERIDALLALNYAGRERYSKVMMTIGRDLALKIADASDHTLSFVSQELVVGGFEARVYPSVMMSVTVEGSSGRKAFEALAAMIGFTFGQQGVLGICSGDLPGLEKVIQLQVTDSGKRSILAADTAAYLYGMLVAYHKDPANTGFTFYPSNGVLSLLDFSGKEKKALEAVTSFVNSLSGGDVVLKTDVLESTTLYVGNNWNTRTAGEDYRLRFGDFSASFNTQTAHSEIARAIDNFLGNGKGRF